MSNREAFDRITGFMQAWDQGEVIATSVGHGRGRQELRWRDLVEAREVFANGQGDEEAPAPADVSDDLFDRYGIWDAAIETVSGDSPITGVRERLREEYDRTFARYRVAPTGYDDGYLDGLDMAIGMLDTSAPPQPRRLTLGEHVVDEADE